MVRLRTQKLNLKKVWNKFKKVVDNKKWGDNIRDVAKTVTETLKECGIRQKIILLTLRKENRTLKTE